MKRQIARDTDTALRDRSAWLIDESETKMVGLYAAAKRHGH